MVNSDWNLWLTQAVQSAEQADWTSVTRTLQRLVRGEGARRATALTQLPEAVQQQWLDLAVQVLESGDFQLRWEIGKLLPSFGTAALELLLDLLQDEDVHPDMQWFVVRALGDFPEPQIIPLLLQMIQTSPQPELQQAAANVLAQMGPQVIEMLPTLLETTETRALAVKILSQLRHVDALPLLLELSRDNDAGTRAMAIDALSGFHSPQVAQVLQQSLSDYARVVRLTAVRSVAFCWQDLPDTEWLDYLQPLLQDIDLEVSRQTALTLGRIGSRDAIKVLAETLRSPLIPTPLAVDVIRSLCWVEQREALMELGQIWATTTLSDTLRQAIVQNMGRLSDAALRMQATAQLLQWLRQDACVAASIPLRQTVITALGQLRQSEALEPLIHCLVEADPWLRLHLTAALKQIDAVQAQDRLVAIQGNPDSTEPLRQSVTAVLQDWR